MNKIIISLSIVLLLLGSLGFNSVYAAGESLKQQVGQMVSGDVLIEKIDRFAILVWEKNKQDSSFWPAINAKIEVLQKKYNKETDIKFQNISIILLYIEKRISDELWISSSRLLNRFQKIEVDSHKWKFESRINKIKGKDYQRIHLKK